MASFIETIIRKNKLTQEDVTYNNWDTIQYLVQEESDDTRYNQFTYKDIYPNPYINKSYNNRGRGRKKSRKHKKRKSKKSRKHRKKTKSHYRR
jgi:hypothetical protein